MRTGKFRQVVIGMAGMALLASLALGCGPTQEEKDLAARMDTAASRTETAANKAEAAARGAAEAAQRAEAAAQRAEAIFKHHVTK